jgi:hypothetical protein
MDSDARTSRDDQYRLDNKGLVLSGGSGRWKLW